MVSLSQTVLAALALLGSTIAASASMASTPAASAPAASAPAASAAATPAAPICHNADALGTARTVAIGGAPEIGLKTYPRTLALQDHEVVLTFDDGPSGSTTPEVLKALGAQCVEATFFLIGRNAQTHPDLVRREIAEGHSVGHHTWDHPAVTLRGLDEAAALKDIDRGMEADDKAAGYGPWTGEPHTPFFRFPGFGDTTPLLATLAKRHIAVFGADLWASDWIPMTPDAEFDRLMSRLGTAGRGIILLHDTKKQTAEMLPRFLAALKTEGYHVVHIVPGGDTTPIRPAPEGWTSETERALDHLWPKARAASERKPVADGERARGADAADPAAAPVGDESDMPLKPSED